jgi:hypothetical protein
VPGHWGVLLKRANYLIENALHRARPALAKAIEACWAFNAKLVIAKFDCLSRDARGSLSGLGVGTPPKFVSSALDLAQMLTSPDFSNIAAMSS